jgi:3-oxoacyl-[acyl-carrier protein] reductase
VPNIGTIRPVDTGLRDSVVLVTGASRGIGAATARRFAGEGAAVVVNYRERADAAEALAAELPDAIAVKADVSREEDVDRLFAAALDRYGRIDVCVCNAAVYEPDAPAATMDAARFRRVVDTNLTGTFLTARAFLRVVGRQRSGTIVLVGSTAGLFGEEGQADYAASKAAITGGLLPTLKNEIVRLAPGGRVNAVCPGWTRTDMAEAALAVPGAVDRATRTMALRKVAEPDDVAWQIVVLASDRLSGHVSGQVVVVAGGMEGRLLHE